MIGDFGDRNPRNRDIKVAEYAPEKWKEFSFAREEVATKAIKKAGGKVETYRVLVQVDLNGMYMRLHKWLAEAGMPIKDGLILSRFAFFQIYDAFERIKKSIVEISGGEFADFEGVTEDIRTTDNEGIWIDPNKTYLKFSPQFDLFYAPSPHKDIEWKLRKEARSGNFNLQRLVKNAGKGVIEVYGNERDYNAYDDFIAKLKANPEYSQSEQGFFCYHVGPKGLSSFGEKEVDTRIVIRAMDALYNYEADVICVVSSDQDFLPLSKKASEFGVSFYQADLAKFNLQHNVGRKIKELGSKFLKGRIDPSWPLKVILEASNSEEHKSSALYEIDEDELRTLCQMHNEFNDYHISPNFSSDGTVSGLVLSKPLNL
ncbi:MULTISPECIES: NYN domain-containing protein [unclassified Roseovarius]|uniref:NYN domain-containing protein n=1 Tax=unclassified Roseovarius TaxID=2614913 RepID=UPI00273FE858|nr:NYN domain-containing protein [Roseovarius sp. MMSF_3350]